MRIEIGATNTGTSGTCVDDLPRLCVGIGPENRSESSGPEIAVVQARILILWAPSEAREGLLREGLREPSSKCKTHQQRR